jgi:hypothetical protein
VEYSLAPLRTRPDGQTVAVRQLKFVQPQQTFSQRNTSIIQTKNLLIERLMFSEEKEATDHMIPILESSHLCQRVATPQSTYEVALLFPNLDCNLSSFETTTEYEYTKQLCPFRLAIEDFVCLSAYGYLQAFLRRSSSSGFLCHTPSIFYWAKRNSIYYKHQDMGFCRCRTDAYMPSKAPADNFKQCLRIAAHLGTFKVHANYLKCLRP